MNEVVKRSGKNFFAIAAWILLLLASCVCFAGLVCYSAAEPEHFDRIVIQPLHTFNRGVGENMRQAGAAVGGFVRNVCTGVVEKAAGLYESLTARGDESPHSGSTPLEVKKIPAATEFVYMDGAEYLTGAGQAVRYFNQTDEAWAREPYGVDPIDEYGCGPTALSMVVSSLTGETVYPAEMAEWAAEEGYAAPQSGSYHSIVQGTAEQYGLDCAPLSATDSEGLKEGIADGGLVIALMGPGHFTDGGHFIVLHGVTEAGQVLVADPNSRENSLVLWDVETILSELSSSRDNGAPLWLITAVRK